MQPRGRSPALPPRKSPGGSQQVFDDEQHPPPPYELVAHQQRALEKATAGSASGAGAPLMHNDPRSSSQDSLAPETNEQQRRRTLLLVYIHGFMGNETSFRSFPAHVHNLMTVLIGESHVVHTKLYPRYRSRGSITIARDNFSKWLEPHESDKTDVVLLGHSMGGLLAAEIALMPSPRPASSPLKHRLLGVVNFDVPFLGMHPGIIKSGLASIFRSREEPDNKWDQTDETLDSISAQAQSNADQSPSRMDTLWEKADPNFNPKFANDVALPVRKGWRNAWHFVNKHSNDLTKATKKLVASHMEFGGAMANYSELKMRYARVRTLEEADDRVRQTVVQGGVPPRVRFVNYYTVSTGRVKKSKSPSPHHSRPASQGSGSRTSLSSNGSTDSRRPSVSASRSSSHSRDVAYSDSTSAAKGDSLDTAMDSLRVESSSAKPSVTQSSETRHLDNFPDLPPQPPPLGDLSYLRDENIRKLVVEEHTRAVVEYEQAVRIRDEALRSSKGAGKKPAIRPITEFEPQKPQRSESDMSHAEREALRLQREKERTAAEGRRLRGEPEPASVGSGMHSADSIPRIESRTPSMPASTVESVSTYDRNMLSPQPSMQSVYSTATSGSGKAKKERKFCNLPPKDKIGQLDPCWVRVFMEDVDEVGAHCGLFFVDERYERLVGEVSERIEKWLRQNENITESALASLGPGKYSFGGGLV